MSSKPTRSIRITLDNNELPPLELKVEEGYMLARPTRNFKVELDTSVDPAVIVKRKARVLGQDIRWKRKKSSPEFEFVSIDLLDSDIFPGQAVSAGKQSITCGNTDRGGNHEYIITVKTSDGETYTTTEGDNSGGIGNGDKPVIRNR